MSRAFDFGHLVDLCRRTHDETRRSAARAVDMYLVTRNWLFGWYLVEYEQRGADRAQYGDRLLAKVSRRLQEAGVKGCSATRLKLYRQFYQQHTGIKGIGPTLSDQFASSSLQGHSPTNLRKLREFHHACPEIRQTPSVESVVALPAGIRQTPSVASASPPSEGQAAAIGQTVSDQLPSPGSDERTAATGPTPSEQFASPEPARRRPRSARRKQQWRNT